MFDYALKNDKLNSYKIRDISVSHSCDAISIGFFKKDSLIATGIAINKFREILDKRGVELRIFIDSSWKKVEDAEEVISLISHSNSDFFEFKIFSEKYDLTQENGIIIYYNLDDEYDDEVLEEILSQL